MIRRFAPLAAALALSACAGPNISIRHGVDWQSIRRVAVLNFQDYPGRPGSGAISAGSFSQALLGARYDVVERQQVDRVLREQAFSVSGAVDPKTAKRLGKVLGVDALLIGNLSDFTPARSQVVMVSVDEDHSEPIVVRRQKRVKQGDQWVDVEEDVVEGYRTRHSTRRVPQTYTVDASVGVGVRLVSVESGAVLWAGSSSERGLSVEETVESLARRILKAVKATWPKETQP